MREPFCCHCEAAGCAVLRSSEQSQPQRASLQKRRRAPTRSNISNSRRPNWFCWGPLMRHQHTHARTQTLPAQPVAVGNAKKRVTMSSNRAQPTQTSEASSSSSSNRNTPKNISTISTHTTPTHIRAHTHTHVHIWADTTSVIIFLPTSSRTLLGVCAVCVCMLGQRVVDLHNCTIAARRNRTETQSSVGPCGTAPFSPISSAPRFLPSPV